MSEKKWLFDEVVLLSLVRGMRDDCKQREFYEEKVKDFINASIRSAVKQALEGVRPEGLTVATEWDDGYRACERSVNDKITTAINNLEKGE